ncbi:L-aspartate oxidase [Acetitomaculum ruminis DSM 5522]|uniref:L-aspartate oxidase n=1 Tax=Acetitomaculum ruminis DSM 5522 TaxID=1120918 RepID=A0A1I0YCD2_9FIRM|nr:L-aspartate oxidase [Acetitomaculum ruminis]SFB10140.1 L-aspartate oxidase [Acetitomaculum ruminis DSM 5522]
MKTDVLIVGAGCAGLYCALKISKDKHITVITKSDVEESDSFLAQGGMCMLRGEYDFESYFEDTMRAGHYENDEESVKIMIRSSQSIVRDLLEFGVDFNKDKSGKLAFTKEGAHREKRILYHKDITGKEITGRLYEEAKKRGNIEILTHTTMVDLISKNNECFGAIVKKADGHTEEILAGCSVLACGGIGGLFDHSTNYRHLTGDGLAAAIEHGIELKDVNYIQIHPTTLYTKDNKDRSFLISESVRGEGAKLYDKNMNRFVDELLPRDLLTKAIYEQMKKDGTEFVWEDLRTIPREELINHFPNIVAKCQEMGYDVFNECIPVVPAQHYFMGGIKVDHQSKTSMEKLYAIGETACNGVHGKNRLASNSLLESLVFAARAAAEISLFYENEKAEENFIKNINLSMYEDYDSISKKNARLVLEEIRKEDIKAEIVRMKHKTTA